MIKINAALPVTSPLAVEPASDPRQQDLERALAGQLGKTMRGDVLAKMNDGSYLVKVAGAAARMMLPPSTPVGVPVSLHLVALQPRPTFHVDSGAHGAAPSVVMTEAGPALLPGPEGSAARGAPLAHSAGNAAVVHDQQMPAAPGLYTAGPHASPGAPGLPAAVIADTADLSDARGHPNLTPTVAGPATATAQPAAAVMHPPAALPVPVGLPTAPGLPAPPGAPKAGDLPAPPAPAAGVGAAEAGTDPALARPLAPGAMLLSKAPLTPASALPAIDLASTPDHLSTGARTIAGVLAAAARAPQQTAVVSNTPLLPAGPVQPQFLAQALRDALGKSGLFYESHLKEWSEGTRPLAELAREPQMQRAAPEPGAARRDPAADPATAGFINLQLATQEQGRINWLGQVMPGQPLEWHIERDAPEKDERGHGGDEQPAWRSGMRLRFPGLGEINASVVLSGGHVHLRLDAGSPEAAAQLRARVGALGESLEAAGAPLGSFAVREH